jgi:hypothetical protein
LAGILSAEQEQRQDMATFAGSQSADLQPGEMDEFEAVLEGVSARPDGFGG